MLVMRLVWQLFWMWFIIMLQEIIRWLNSYWDGDKTAKNNPYFNVEAPHPYSVFHDFNHESPLVRKFVKRNLQFLLKEYKVDGFRFDLTK
ncbi:alpha amylase, partial [Moraxella bovoculi 237]